MAKYGPKLRVLKRANITSFSTGFPFLFCRTFAGQRVAGPGPRGRLLLVLPPVQHVRLLN